MIGPSNRLKKEMEMAKIQLTEGFSASPISEDNLLLWKATIPGPKNSPFEGGSFDLEIMYGLDYPWQPPKVKFLTKVYHPNISPKGGICLDILKKSWSPCINIITLLLSISSLLTEPNTEHGLSLDILAICKMNPSLYEENARKWTQLYAMKK